MLFRSGIKDAYQFCDQLLEKYHVALVAGGAFGQDGTVRLSYANSMDNITEGVRKFAEFLGKIKA